MPQLVPFFFLNAVVFTFSVLVIMIYLFSKYLLPTYVRLYISRFFIWKI